MSGASHVAHFACRQVGLGNRDVVGLACERDQAIPEFVDVTVPSAGVTVKARIVWTAQSAVGDILCGAEVVAADDNEASGWREFVDDVM